MYYIQMINESILEGRIGSHPLVEDLAEHSLTRDYKLGRESGVAQGVEVILEELFNRLQALQLAVDLTQSGAVLPVEMSIGNQVGDLMKMAQRYKSWSGNKTPVVAPVNIRGGIIWGPNIHPHAQKPQIPTIEI